MAKKIPNNDDQMTLGASLLGDLYEEIAQELMLRMIKRMIERGAVDLAENPYVWQLQKLQDMHMLNAENIAYIKQQVGVANELIDEILVNEGITVYQKTADQLAKDLNQPAPSNNDVHQTLEAIAAQTTADLANFVNESLLSKNLGVNPAMIAYRRMITKAVVNVTTGAMNTQQAFSKAVELARAKGISSSFKDKGGRNWRFDSYARMLMQTTTYKTYNMMRTQAADEMGVSTFHMSSHKAARPACAPIQGHIVTKQPKGFNSEIGYVPSLYEHDWGEAGGTLGINCHHVLTPFIIGVNELPDEDIPSPADAIANGKEQAKQRAFEREIRDAKYHLEAAKLLRDKDLIDKYRQRVSSLQRGIRELLDQPGNDFLSRDYSREKVFKDAKRIEALKNTMSS